jgi:hypothetical protein
MKKIINKGLNEYGVKMMNERYEGNRKLYPKEGFTFKLGDRIGKVSMKFDDQEEYGKNNFKGNSPLALENAKTIFAKNKTLIECLAKRNVFEKDKRAENLLNENQLLDE